MELIVKGTFHRDVIAYKNTELLNKIYSAIQNVEKVKSISHISHFKKLKKYDIHYRIKIGDDYRIGVVVRKNKVWFIRFGHRNNFYKRFP